MQRNVVTKHLDNIHYMLPRFFGRASTTRLPPFGRLDEKADGCFGCIIVSSSILLSK